MRESVLVTGSATGLNVNNGESLQRAVHTTVQESGGIYGVVNNAGNPLVGDCRGPITSGAVGATIPTQRSRE